MKYFFFLFGCVALVVTAIGWRQLSTLSNDGVIADGIVTSIAMAPNTTTSKNPNSHYNIYYPVITFKTADGTSASFQSLDGSRDTSENLIGTHLAVVYDPSNPSIAIVQSSNNLKGSITVGAIFTIIFFALGLFLYFRSKRNYVINNSSR